MRRLKGDTKIMVLREINLKKAGWKVLVDGCYGQVGKLELRYVRGKNKGLCLIPVLNTRYNVSYLEKKVSIKKINTESFKETLNFFSAVVTWFSTVLLDMCKRSAISSFEKCSSLLITKISLQRLGRRSRYE
jgi:hypothetical protein